MNKYRIREGSFLDYARHALTGIVFFVGLAIVYGLSV